MKLIIETADNGYILSYYDPEIKEKRSIAVEEDKNGSQAKTTQKLFWEIEEYFCLFGSKHDEERCYIEVRDKNGKEIE